MALAALAALAAAAPAWAQSAGGAYERAQDLETKEQYAAAAAAYREALQQSANRVPAILGLERVYAQLGQSDSLLPILDSALARSPSDGTLHAAQLRTLRALGDGPGIRTAFDRWRRAAPHDPAPYREFVRMLLDDGLTATADTILREGQADVGSVRPLEYETAQLAAATGQWERSAQAWRTVVSTDAFLSDAAIYALGPTPAATRDAVMRALGQPPLVPAALRIVGALQVAWGAPRAGWDQLRRLPSDSTTRVVWLDFARRAEDADAWLVARDAVVAASGAQPSLALLTRAATDALNGGDATGASALAAKAEAGAGAGGDSSTVAYGVLAVHLRALATLGKPDEANRLLAAYDGFLVPEQRARYARLVAWGWVRTGDLARAKQALSSSPGEAGDAATGWIALYEGDLATARSDLKPGPDATTETLEALALLSRTQASRSAPLGRAFLTLARGDTLEAADAFASAADSLTDARSALLATAARLYDARNAEPRAIAMWSVIVDSLGDSPEAPEAELDWARALLRAKQTAAGIARLEHLILTHPESALVPQARRELEVARRAVPSTS